MRGVLRILGVLALIGTTAAVGRAAVSDPWRPAPDLLTPRSRAAAAASGNAVYVIGGDAAGFVRLSSVEVRHPGGPWRAGMPVGVETAGLSATTGANGVIYVASAADDGAFRAYDPRSGTWTTLPSMPTARSGAALTTGSDGRIFAVGGEHFDLDAFATVALDTVEAFDPATRTWSELAPLPLGRGELAAVTAADGRIYALGGTDRISLLPSADVFVYDPTTNSWQSSPPMPTARRALGATTVNGLIYAIGGFGDPSFQAGLTTVEIYDPAVGSWTTGPSLNQGRVFPAVATLHDTISVIGGSTNLDMLGSVETLRVH